MQLRQEQSLNLALEQSLRLTPMLIERFNVLQQTTGEIQETLEKKSKENPFLSVRFMDKQSSVPYSLSAEDEMSPIDYATMRNRYCRY